MAENEEKNEARADTAPEPPEPAPRGNVHSRPADEDTPGRMPPPLPH